MEPPIQIQTWIFLDFFEKINTPKTKSLLKVQTCAVFIQILAFIFSIKIFFKKWAQQVGHQALPEKRETRGRTRGE